MSLHESRICRICQQSKNLQNLLSSMHYVKQYLACANVKFEIDDELPKYICETCLINLRKAFNFKEQCEYTEKKLKWFILQEKLQNTNKLKILHKNDKLMYNTTVDDDDENPPEKTSTTDRIVEVSTATEKEVITINHTDENPKKLSSLQPLKTYGNTKKHALPWRNNDINSLFQQKPPPEFKIITIEPRLLYDPNFQEPSPKLQSPPPSPPSQHPLHEENKINPPPVFNCEMCPNITWNKKLFLLKHFRIKHQAKIPSKNQCQKCWKWYVDLDSHMIYHENDVFKCPICLRNVKSLNRHTRIVHNKVRRFVCDICNSRFGEYSALKIHMDVHQKIDHQCKYCDKILNSYNRLMLHKRKFHPEMIAKRMKLNETIKKPIPPDYISKIRKKYKGCSYQYYKKRDEDKWRTKLQPLCCEYCMKISSSQKSHMAHEKTHLNDGDKKYKCNQCGRWVTKLAVHQLKHTDITKPFQCSVCGLKFRLNCHLSQHERFKHNGAAYMCHMCGKNLSNSESLKLHIRLHTNEKPYKCIDCNESFISFVKLTRHCTKNNHKLK